MIPTHQPSNSSMMRFLKGWTIHHPYIVLAIPLVGWTLLLPTMDSNVYTYDEADYMYAASQGLLDNYLDIGAMPFSSFLDSGLKALSSQLSRHELSQRIRSYDDIGFYRHYHGPLYFYGLTMAHNALGQNEQAVRAASSLCLVGTAVAFCLGAVHCSSAPRLTGITASMLLFATSPNLETSLVITPHNLYAVTSLLTLIFMVKYLRDARRRSLDMVAFWMALSVLTIEFAPLLLLTFLVCVAMHGKLRTAMSPYANSALRFVAIVAITTLFVWPAGIMKGGLVRNYLFFGYYALFRNDDYGSTSPWSVWWLRITSEPLPWITIGLAIIVFSLRAKTNLYLLPLLVYPTLLFLTTLRNSSPLPQYVSSMVPPLYLFVGIVLSKYVVPPLRPDAASLHYRRLALGTAVGSLALLLACCVSNVQEQYRKAAVIDRSSETHACTFVGQRGLMARSVLIDKRLGPTLHFYFPAVQFDTFWEAEMPWRDIVALVRRNGYEGILYAGKEHSELLYHLQAEFDYTSTRVGGKVAYYEVAPAALR